MIEGSLLEQQLKKALLLVNDVARIAPPGTFEASANTVIAQVGANGLLNAAANLRVVDADYVRQNLNRFVAQPNSYEGQVELRNYVARNEPYVRQLRRIATAICQRDNDRQSPGGDRETITVDEAARLLGISRNKAYEEVNQGTIPSLRFGRKIVVSRRALDRLLAGEEHLQ